MNDIWLRTAIPKQQLRSRYYKDLCKKMIEKGGTSSHSGLGMSLRLILERLEDARCPYKLTAHPGRGYFVEVDKPEDRPTW